MRNPIVVRSSRYQTAGTITSARTSPACSLVSGSTTGSCAEAAIGGVSGRVRVRSDIGPRFTIRSTKSAAT